MRPPVCSIAPTSPSATASLAVFPNNDTDPASGVVKPSSMSIVVDFPAPFGPRSATVSPGAIETSTPWTARTIESPDPNDLTRPRSSTPAARESVDNTTTSATVPAATGATRR